jgi:hypothetical protein
LSGPALKGSFERFGYHDPSIERTAVAQVQHTVDRLPQHAAVK